MKIKKYKIAIPIYDVVLDIWIGGQEKDFIAQINKKFQEDLEKMIEDGRSGCYVSFKMNKKNKERITDRVLWIETYNEEIIIHEAFHFVAELMAYKNIHLIETTNYMYHHSSEEAWAYLLEYLFKEIKKKLR